jgi:hypothetical protein
MKQFVHSLHSEGDDGDTQQTGTQAESCVPGNSNPDKEQPPTNGVDLACVIMLLHEVLHLFEVGFAVRATTLFCHLLKHLNPPAFVKGNFQYVQCFHDGLQMSLTAVKQGWRVQGIPMISTDVTLLSSFHRRAWPISTLC